LLGIFFCRKRKIKRRKWRKIVL